MGREPWDAESDPEEAERARDLVVQRVRARTADPRLTYATGIVVALLAIAVVKPWTIGQVPVTPPPPRPATAPPVTPVPTRDTTAEGLASPICLGAGAWQVASFERWPDQDVRVWRAIEPLEDASGPLDPLIPSTPVVAHEVKALGWCAPAYGPNKPVGPALVTVWWVRDELQVQLRVRQVQPASGATPLAALYAVAGPCGPQAPCPSTGLGQVSPAWATGRVVFQWEDLGTGREAWFAARVSITREALVEAPTAT